MMLEFTLENWENHPCVKGRPAVERDVRENRATFASVNATGKDAALDTCPLPGILTTDEGDRISVIVLQAQRAPDGSGYIVGAVDQAGHHHIASSDEILILNGPTPEWTADLETPR